MVRLRDSIRIMDKEVEVKLISVKEAEVAMVEDALMAKTLITRGDQDKSLTATLWSPKTGLEQFHKKVSKTSWSQ